MSTNENLSSVQAARRIHLVRGEQSNLINIQQLLVNVGVFCDLYSTTSMVDLYWTEMVHHFNRVYAVLRF